MSIIGTGYNSVIVTIHSTIQHAMAYNMSIIGTGYNSVMVTIHSTIQHEHVSQPSSRMPTSHQA